MEKFGCIYVYIRTDNQHVAQINRIRSNARCLSTIIVLADSNARLDLVLHSPDVTGLSVHALPAIVVSSTAPVNSRSRPREVPGTRCTRRSPIIAVPDGREGARPASRLRVRTPRESVFLYLSCIIPSLFPPRADASAALEPSPVPGLRLNPAHLSLINR